MIGSRASESLFRGAGSVWNRSGLDGLGWVEIPSNHRELHGTIFGGTVSGT